MAQNSTIFSKRQQEAINWDNNRELLISAAAGSGKTTVLINRIIDRIVVKRIPIDAFLVVTFTHASANELKERICAALTDAIKAAPDDEWLSVQLANVGRASIGTMHSFCLKVIKENHEHKSILLPKSVRIISEEKSKQMLDEAVDDIFTDEYSKKDNASFAHMLDVFASFRNDVNVRELVKELYKFALNNEEPYEWIDTIAKGEKACDYLEEAYAFIRKVTAQAYELCNYTAKNIKTDSKYNDMVLLACDRLNKCIKFIDEKNYDGVLDIFENGFDFINLRSGKIKDENILAQKNVIKYIKNEFLSFAEIKYDKTESHSSMNDALCELCRVATLVGKRFAEKKRAAKSVDYSDMEHMVLELFNDESIAEIYRSKFRHIMFDEYQDCNRLQEKIVKKIAKNSVYFMVGDVKQSIYSFRQAEPGLFLEKYNSYKYAPDAEYAVIELNENYRSRKNVLNAANKVFFSIMQKDFCGMDYSSQNALNAMASYPQSDEDTFSDEPVKVALISGKGLSASDKLQAQLLYVIDNIKTYIKNKSVYDVKAKTFRRIHYSDIAILMRSPKNLLRTVRETFAATQIPINILQDDDIKYVPEINLIMCLLQCIENPYNDVALMSVLHSYIFSLTDNELMHIMNSELECSRELITKVTAYIAKADAFPEYAYEANGINIEICRKLKLFMKKYAEWTENESYMPIMDFIDYLLDDTGYIEYFGAFENGQHRRENILRLYDALKQQLSAEPAGLYECVRILKSIDENGLAGTNNAGTDDAVYVMSVHKSKGLEFPVVFLIDADRSFSDEATKKTVLMHKDYGIISEEIDAENRLKYNTLSYEALKRIIKKEQREEEQRILYVAMTRAKEQLIIVGAQSAKQLERDYIGKSLVDIASANNALEWILYSLCADSASIEYPVNAKMLDSGMFYKKIAGGDYDSLWKVDICNSCFDEYENCIVCNVDGRDLSLLSLSAGKEILQIGDSAEYRSNSLPDYESLIEKLSYRYPHEDATNINSKLSVSQIKHIAEHELDDDTYEIPDYRYDKIKVISTDESMTPTRLGTLYHFFMQHASVKYPYMQSDFENDIANMLAKKLITPDEAKFLKPNKFMAYFNSDTGKLMARAKAVEREKSFTYYVKANTIFPNVMSDEKILVQGVIDCYFCDENGDYVLIDYKTDKVYDSNGEELVDKHRKQIELYKAALRDISGINISRSFIYSFALEKFIRVE